MLSKEIKRVFEEHKGRYGSLRISKSLETEGIKVNHKRVGKLMRLMELYAKGARYRYKHYHAAIQKEEHPNLLNQTFQTTGKNPFLVGRYYIHSNPKRVFIFVYFYRYFFSKNYWMVNGKKNER